MYTEHEEREIRRWEIFDSLPADKAFKYLESVRRDDVFERSIDRNSRGWFQPTEIFKGWLFAKFLMIGAPIIAILVGLFNRELVEHGLITHETIDIITDRIILLGIIALIYKVGLKWIFKISTWWILLVCTIISIINPSRLMIVEMGSWVVMATIVLGAITLISKIFSKK